MNRTFATNLANMNGSSKRMPKYTPSISNVAQAVLFGYGDLRPKTDEDRRVNAALEHHLRQWFSSVDRQLTNAADYCIDRFVNAEIDFHTEGNRGLGRMTDYWARFGGKYRKVLRSLDPNSLQELRRAFADQLLCGYLFGEYLIECTAGKKVPRDHFPDGPEGVFERWVPTIYDKSGPRAFDKEFSHEAGQSYYDVKGLWGHATGDAVHACFQRHGIPIDEYAQLLLRQYFDAGIMLRVTEMERVSDDEHYDTITSGAYSATKNVSPQSKHGTGCLVMFAITAIGSAMTAIELPGK